MQRNAIALALALFSPITVTCVAAEPLSAAGLRKEIHAALRAESTTNGPEHETAVRRLTELYDILKAHPELSDAARRQLTAQMRSRLKRVQASLLKALDQHSEKDLQQSAASTSTPKPQAILAQVPGNVQGGGAAAGIPRRNIPAAPPANAAGAGGNPFAAQTVANANQLIELIQNTIAPKSWDVRGGPGTIRYFAPAQVLVVRQTGGIHDQVQGAIGQMRANRAP